MIARIWAGIRSWIARLRAPRQLDLKKEVTVHAGIPMPLERIPIRSTKADGKRRALDYARKRFNDPTMTWGQARKRLEKLERQENARLARKMMLQDKPE